MSDLEYDFAFKNGEFIVITENGVSELFTRKLKEDCRLSNVKFPTKIFTNYCGEYAIYDLVTKKWNWNVPYNSDIDEVINSTFTKKVEEIIIPPQLNILTGEPIKTEKDETIQQAENTPF